MEFKVKMHTIFNKLKKTMEHIANKTRECIRAVMRKNANRNAIIEKLGKQNERFTVRPYQQCNSH